jgi:hypothetical protein
MEYQIEITPARRWNGSSWVGHGSYYASHEGQRIGEWRVPECDAARWLKANRGAADSDILITTRAGKPSMRGPIGWLAARTVEENKKVSPRWAKHRPWTASRGSAVASQAAEVAAEVHLVTPEQEQTPVSRYVPPSEARLKEIAEERAERRRRGATLKPKVEARPDFTIRTMDGASWSEGSRYMRWTLPTALGSPGGAYGPPSKRQARVRQ